MSRIIKKIKENQDRVYFWGLVILLSLLSIYLWFYGAGLIAGIMDISYHVSTASAFARVGGIVGWDFWESLPLGRAHNYPPLLHIIFANLIKTGLSIPVCIKIMLELVIVGGFAVYAEGVSKLFSVKVAFWSVFFLALSRIFLYYSATMMPSAVAVFLSPLLFYFLLNRKFLSYAVVLAFILYTHLFLPFVLLFAVLVYLLVWQRELLWPAAKATIAALLIYSPWLIHVILGFKYIKYFDSSYPLAVLRGDFSVNLIVMLLAIISAAKALKPNRSQNSLVSVCALLVAFLLVSVFASGRALGSFAMIPLAALAGYTVVNFWNKRILQYVIAVLIVIYPVRLLYLESSAGRLIASPEKSILSSLKTDTTITRKKNYFEKYSSLFTIIEQNSTEGQSIASAAGNFDPTMHYFTKTYQFVITNFIGGVTSRPSLNLRMPEIYHSKKPDLSKAKIIFLNTSLASLSVNYFSEYGYDPMSPETSEMTKKIKNSFVEIASYPAQGRETFFVYKRVSNDGVISEIRPKFVFPLYIADLIIALLIGLLIAENKNCLLKRGERV